MTTKHDHAFHHKAANHHRKAAHHFEATAKHQLAAAEANDHDDEVETGLHAYLAYGHQIQAVHYAEMVTKEDESVDHADVDHGDSDHVKNSTSRWRIRTAEVNLIHQDLNRANSWIGRIPKAH